MKICGCTAEISRRYSPRRSVKNPNRFCRSDSPFSGRFRTAPSVARTGRLARSPTTSFWKKKSSEYVSVRSSGSKCLPNPRISASVRKSSVTVSMVARSPPSSEERPKNSRTRPPHRTYRGPAVRAGVGAPLSRVSDTVPIPRNAGELSCSRRTYRPRNAGSPKAPARNRLNRICTSSGRRGMARDTTRGTARVEGRVERLLTELRERRREARDDAKDRARCNKRNDAWNESRDGRSIGAMDGTTCPSRGCTAVRSSSVRSRFPGWGSQCNVPVSRSMVR